MNYVVEAWNVKPEWLALSVEQRGEYMKQVGAATEALVAKGVNILTWSGNDPKVSKRADYDYFAVWSFPNQEVTDEFFATVEGAGWYNYFEQVNMSGEEATAGDIIGQLVQL